MNSRQSERGLMLVEDPLSTLKALSNQKDPIITWKSFKKQYEKEIDREKNHVDEKTVDTHFYTLTTFNLLTPLEIKGQYRLSYLGKDLCKFLNDGDLSNLKEGLKAILLGNYMKGKLFSDFLQFVNKPKNKKEVFEEFKNIPGRSLIAWCYFAELIDQQNDEVWKLNQDIHKISSKEFYNVFIKTFNEMKKTKTFAVSRLFISIDEIRINVCYNLGGISINIFDNYLTKLLDSERGDKIRLYGAPSSVFEERKNFIYKNKLYAHISVGM